MLIILALIILFHVTSVILLFTATINNVWWVSGNSYMDLWYHCNETSCNEIPNSSTIHGVYLQAVQATMILSTILCCVGFFVFILQLFRLKQGERFVFPAIVQLMSALCVMTAASIYTAEHMTFKSQEFEKGDYGYCFVLAWVAFPMTLLSGLMYLVLRKRK
ncbi:epithelial membrane protein 2 [Misgurnus anguillicaudatus]|uniref:epithelial membrane protein 2 n=1 Tax=Misgurnus anguillicaudatus TaxID=75329 RepID=UPI003CCFD9DD